MQSVALIGMLQLTLPAFGSMPVWIGVLTWVLESMALECRMNMKRVTVPNRRNLY